MALAGIAGRTLVAAGLAFTAMAPLADRVFTAYAQTSDYNPQANPFQEDKAIDSMATLAIGSASDTRGRVSALFDMLRTSSPTGLKTVSRAGRPPRTAIETVREGGDCGELATVVLAAIDAMNRQDAGIEADAIVVHFRDSPSDEEHMVARALVDGVPLIIDPQAETIGMTKNSSYDVVFRLAPGEAAEMYQREYGDYFRDRGDWSRAMKAYGKALDIFNGDSYVHQNFGVLCEKAGNMAAADAQYEVADSLAPGRYAKDKARGDYNNELSRGDQEYRKGDLVGCIDHFRNALRLGTGLKHDDSATIEEYIDACEQRQR